MRLQFREIRALAKRKEKTIDLGVQFFFYPPTSLSLRGDSPAPRRGSESELSFTARDLKIVCMRGW